MSDDEERAESGGVAFNQGPSKPWQNAEIDAPPAAAGNSSGNTSHKMAPLQKKRLHKKLSVGSDILMCSSSARNKELILASRHAAAGAAVHVVDKNHDLGSCVQSPGSRWVGFKFGATNDFILCTLNILYGMVKSTRLLTWC